MVLPTDKEWLEKCQPEALPVPPFDRYIYVVEDDVVKKGLQPGELGYDGYQPGTGTIAQRDENESHTLERSLRRFSMTLEQFDHQVHLERLFTISFLSVVLSIPPTTSFGGTRMWMCLSSIILTL